MFSLGVYRFLVERFVDNKFPQEMSMKKKISIVLMALLVLYCTDTATAKCTREARSWYCDGKSEAIKHAVKIKASVYVIDRNYEKLLPVTVKVMVHETSSSAFYL